MSRDGFDQIKAIFLENDLDGSGELDAAEFKRLIDDALGRGELSNADADRLFKHVDQDGNKSVSLQELQNTIGPDLQEAINHEKLRKVH